MDNKTSRSVCYNIFCIANTNSVKRLHLLQKKIVSSFEVKISIQVLKCVDKTTLENCNFISKSLKTLLSPVWKAAGSNIHLNETLMLQHKQIFFTFKFSFTELKPVADIPLLHMQYLFGILYKAPLSISYCIFSKQIQLTDLSHLTKASIYWTANWLANLQLKQENF